MSPFCGEENWWRGVEQVTQVHTGPLSQCLRNPSSVGIFQALRNALSSPVDVLSVHRMALTSKMEN